MTLRFCDKHDNDTHNNGFVVRLESEDSVLLTFDEIRVRVGEDS